MSARSLTWTRPASKASDGEQVAVRRGDLRELAAGLSFLLAVAEASDASDPDDPGTWPDELLFLREATNRVAALAGSSPQRPASVTDLCDALADEFGCSPTEADRLAAGLAREADNAARVLLEPGTPCPPVRVRDRVAAVLLTAAAKRKA